MVDMTAEHPVNEILAICWYHVIYTIPYRHSGMRFIQVAPSVESKQSAWQTRVSEFL